MPDILDDEESEACPGKPITPGVPEDGLHCACWYEDLPCCRCMLNPPPPD